MRFLRYTLLIVPALSFLAFATQGVQAQRTVASGRLPTPIFSTRLRSGLNETTLSAPTFTRASAGTWLDATGTVRTLPANLLSYSQDFTNAAWGKFDASITANATTAPDGTLTAQKIVEDTTNSSHYARQSFTYTAALYVISVYMKAGERTQAWVSLDAANFDYFNLSNGSVSSTGSGMTAQIQSVGNGWYRCTASKTMTAAGGLPSFGIAIGGNYIYTGNGTSGIYIWPGAQLETGSVATSLIQTTNATATRAADVLTYPSAGNISAAGSVFAWVRLNGLNSLSQGDQVIVTAGFDATSNIFALDANYNGFPQVYVGPGGVGTRVIVAGSSPSIVGAWTQVGVTWAPGSVILYQNGVSAGSLNMTPGFTLSASLFVGEFSNSTLQLNGDIRDLRVYSRVLSASEVSALFSGGM